MTINETSRVGQIAAEHPLATRVFARHNIDFCCGGGRTLSDACRRSAADPDAVINELRVEIEGNRGPEKRWDQAPLTELVGHILTEYHAPLREELPRLNTMAAKVRDVHGDKFPDTLPEIASVVEALVHELESHMQKEERILFPAILAGRGADASNPIAVMEHEHESAGRALARLRELTDDYEVPEWACNTWRALWHGLAALEESLHRHIHLENNILFPRALGRQIDGATAS